MANRSAIWDFIEEIGGAAPSAQTPRAGDGVTAPPPTTPVSGDDDVVAVVTKHGDDKPVQNQGITQPEQGDKRSGDGEPVSKEQAEYEKELVEVKKLRTALGKHAQAGHVDDKLKQADDHLKAAAEHASTPNVVASTVGGWLNKLGAGIKTQADWPKAMAELASAKRACEQGKEFADAFADYMAKRTEAAQVLTAAKASGWKLDAKYDNWLKSAAQKADPKQRKYDKAKEDVQKVFDELAPLFKQWYVDDVKPQIQKLGTLTGAPFIQKEIGELNELMRKEEEGIAAKQWRVVVLAAGLIQDNITAAKKMAERKAGYDTDRTAADNAIKKLQGGGAPVAAPLGQLQKRFEAADKLATKEAMRFEDAIAEAKAIVTECEAVEKLAKDSEAYTKERGELDDELKKLREHAAKEKIKSELDVVQGLLDEALKAAGDTGAAHAALVLDADRSKHDLATANARLKQARANLATAKSLAESLGEVAKVEGAVKDQSDLGELTKAYETLTKELETAKQAAHADLATQELGEAKSALAEAKKQIDAKQAEAVKQALTTATDKLTAARRLQVEHARYVERHDGLKKQLEQLTKDPGEAKKIQDKITALDTALKEAETAETGKDKDHAKAMAALDKAETAAGAADDAQKARAAFDKDADKAENDLKQPGYSSIKDAQTIAVGKARELADKYDFAGAAKALKAIRNKIDAADVEATARKTPPTGLADMAKKLYEAGATKELDDLIQKLPDNLAKDTLVALAQARYPGVTFQFDNTSAEPQKSLKRMCQLMQTIPEDALVGNPSLKTIRHSNKGASYNQGANLVNMNSRPKESPKADFEPGVTGRLPPRDPGYEPANNNPEDLFDFNMVHELAHSIDDARNFMNQHLDDANFGGWQVHGGNIDPIVQAVIANTGFGTTPEERKYIVDCILRNEPTPPATFTGDKTKFDEFYKAAQHDGVWSNQALSDKATMGTRIYHEAYGSTWVSYLADARKKGITGYQFRAPGEWFAELYAAWKLKKLKPGHPAITWLSTLNPEKK
jgi:hypothetical protein